MPLPIYQASGTPQAAAAAAMTVPWPVHRVGDIGLLMIESCGGQAAPLTTAAGFAAITNSPQATGVTTAGTQLTIYWCRATTTAMASPVVTAISDHGYCRILTYRYCRTAGNPWHATAGAVKAATSTTMTWPTVTTSFPNALIILASACDIDSAGGNITAAADCVNANLSSFSFVQNAGSTLGTGGSISAPAARKLREGDLGTTTDAVLIASAINAMLTIAMAPIFTIAFDVATTGADYALTGSQTTSHLADTAARAACVMIDQNGSVTDQVSGVTYGGVAMTRLRFDTESTQAGGTYIYWLDGIATGTQNVIMTTTASTSKQLTVGTMISDTPVLVAGHNTGTSAGVANPAWNITGLPTGVYQLGVSLTAFEVIHSGYITFPATPAANWNLLSSTDLGSQGRGFAYQDIASNGSATLACGWTATSADFVGSSVAFYSTPPVSVPEVPYQDPTALVSRSNYW